jgi:DNA polymerase III subunit gamma/tau
MVKYPPTVGRYKVYIIDEVHMLSQAAENAFLKTLEEPPEHAIFILATTDPQKVRSTIRSRCMQLNFKRVTESELAAGMERICAKRGIEVTQDALVTIASRADGSVRDALSILEQCIAAGDKKLDRNLVLEYTGAAGEDFFLALTGAVASGDIGKALIYIAEIAKRGKDAKQILKDWLMHYRNLMVVKYVARPGRIIGSSAENAARLKAQADTIDIASIEAAIRLLSEYINIGRYSDRPRILLETAAVRIAGGLSGASYSTQPLTAGQTMPAGQAARPASYGAAGQMAGNAARQAAGSMGSSAGYADRPQTVPASGQAAANSASAPEDDEPLEMIAPAPREKTGSPEIMWNTVVDTIAREDRSFVSFVGRHSRGTLFESGELVVTVRPNKIKHAEDKLVEITRIARGLYGQEVFVTLKAGDPEAAGGKAEAVSEQETSKIIDEDAIVSDIAADVESLFGMKPEITG